MLILKMICFLLLLSFTSLSEAFSQPSSASDTPASAKNQKYLFYLHGGVVQELGVNAVSQYYGKYEYLEILDALSAKGFIVVSEVRKKGTEEKDYAEKIKFQADSLLLLGVSPDNIIILGASQGAYIALEAALLLKNEKMRFVILGLCSDYAKGYFKEYKDQMMGNFLSIFESSDTKGSCQELFPVDSPVSTFKEVKLDMGNSHSFLFKPFDEWIQPVVKWSNTQ